MPWVNFTADHDWTPMSGVTIAYKAGQTLLVTTACARAAIAAGKAERRTKPKRMIDWIAEIENRRPAATLALNIEGDGMQRDMDLVREILLWIDAKIDFEPRPVEIPDRDEMVVHRHVELLFDAGLVDGHRYSGSDDGPGYVDVIDMTWAGHEMVASLRDPEIWRKTKSALNAGGEWTLAMMARTAEAYLKVKLKEVTGLDIG